MTTRSSPAAAVTRDPAGPSLMMRLRTWLTATTLAGVAFVWGLPSVEASFNAQTWWLLRWLVGQARNAGQQIQPLVIVLMVCTVLAWVIEGWTRRQRRRITEQVARQLRVPTSQWNQLRTRIIGGLRAPLRATVRIPSGLDFTDEYLDEVADAISRAWNYAYSLRLVEHRDRLILVRARRAGLSTEEEPEDEPIEYASAAHERIDAVKDKFPITVTHVEPGAHDEDLGEPTSYNLRFETVANAAVETWQTKVSSAIVGLVGRAPEGYQWQTQWFPDEDRLRLDLTEAPPEPQPLSGYLAHPPIHDYASELGTDRIVLPYATGSVSPYLWWDIDPRTQVPHGLISGPTGGGKTTAIGTLISEGSRRDIPWILFDPKRFELTQFAYHPGVIGVATDVQECIEGISQLWNENEERSKWRERRPWINNEDMPLFGVVIDEFLLLSFMLQQEAKKDDEVKKLDPKGKLNTLVSIIRAVGGRVLFGVQRPDASIWGGGNPRSNLNMRLAMSRQDSDGDAMMFDRQGVTSHLDRAVPGRAMGTDTAGDPEECQVWYTPNLNQHPLVHGKLQPHEQELVQQLMPSGEISTQLWTPASSWQFMRPKYRLDDMPDDAPTPAPHAKQSSAPRGEVDMPDLETAVPARTLEPQARIAVHLDGALVPSTLVDIEPDGERLALDVMPDGERSSESITVDREEMVGVIPNSAPTS